MSKKETRLQVREKLKKNNLTNSWLILQLQTYNLEVDKSEMSSVLSGTRKGAKAESILRYSLAVLLYYEKCFPMSNEWDIARPREVSVWTR